MDDLSELTTSVRNIVARPGTFTGSFPETTDDDIIAVLLDALGEAHLEGLLLFVDADEDGMLDVDITRAQGALLVLLAGVRFLRTILLNTSSHVRYEAGPAVYEQDKSTNLLRDILADLIAQKTRVLDQLKDEAEGPNAQARAFYLADQYLIRVCTDSSVYRREALEVANAGLGW